jgi:hypothetical protein
LNALWPINRIRERSKNPSTGFEDYNRPCAAGVFYLSAHSARRPSVENRDRQGQFSITFTRAAPKFETHEFMMRTNAHHDL